MGLAEWGEPGRVRAWGDWEESLPTGSPETLSPELSVPATYWFLNPHLGTFFH